MLHFIPLLGLVEYPVLFLFLFLFVYNDSLRLSNVRHCLRHHYVILLRLSHRLLSIRHIRHRFVITYLAYDDSSPFLFCINTCTFTVLRP